MAIVQISRIQVRRGQKNQGSGVPQLAGGEFGWAVDTRELYIGNGSVSEGSPAVGNTKVITEHDNLFNFADTYEYKAEIDTIQTGPTITNPVTRSLQERLDESVSVKSFGATGDGSDQTVFLQRAIDELYLNPASKGSVPSRIALVIPAGTYNLSSPLRIPPNANIIGEGSEKTVIVQTANAPIMETVNEASSPNSYALDATSTFNNQAKKITIKGLTLLQQTTNTGLKLQSCRSSHFEDLAIKGIWEANNALGADQIGIRLNSLSTSVSTNDNYINNVLIEGFAYGVFSDFDVVDNTFSNVDFVTLGHGVVLGLNTIIGSQGQLHGPQRNLITNSKFRDIDQHGILVNIGNYNTSSNNSFVNVGNLGGANANAIHSTIKFTEGTALSNSSNNDFFDRTSDLSFNQTLISGYKYTPDIEGPGVFENGFSYRIPITQQNSYVRILRASGEVSKNIEVEYIYKSTHVNALREGVLDILVNRADGTTTTSDDFTFLGDDTVRNNLQFRSVLSDEDGDGNTDTIVIEMINTTTSDTGSILFKVKYKS